MLIKRLDFVMIPWGCGYVINTVLLGLLLFSKFFIYNQYVLVPFIWLNGAFTTFFILLGTRSASDLGLHDLETSPRHLPSNPALTDRDISRLSESQSHQTHSDHSVHTAPGTPILPTRYPGSASWNSSPQLPTIARLHPSSSTEMTQFTLSSLSGYQGVGGGFGLDRLEEGEWISQDEIGPSLTIDTTDRNPKVITVIETIEDDNTPI